MVRPRRFVLPRFLSLTKTLLNCVFWLVIADIEGWGLSPRGAGYLFGSAVTKEFVRHNGLDFIARAHQLVSHLEVFSSSSLCRRLTGAQMISLQVMEGYKQMFDQTIVTVWCVFFSSCCFQLETSLDPTSLPRSAPNYCYRSVSMFRSTPLAGATDTLTVSRIAEQMRQRSQCAASFGSVESNVQSV